MVRSPAVAGKFYQEEPGALEDEVRSHLPPPDGKVRALGLVAPHAGFMYSGDVAGSVYARIQIPDTVIIIGPNHTGYGKPVALMAHGRWNMPFGDLEIDAPLAEAILKGLPEARDDETAHHYEHSIETQLPFLQYFRKDFKFVPLCLMRVSYEECERVSRAILAAIREINRPVLIVASTDMTHYESHASASEKDRLAIEKILQLDPKGLHDTVRDHQITMCGVNPTVVMLLCVKELGATRAELVRYMTSGEVSGDMDYVVGYAGIVVT